MVNTDKVQINELESQLAKTDDPQCKIDLMNALAEQLRYVDLSRALALAEQASDMSGQGDLARRPYQKGRAESLNLLGSLNVQHGNYNQALSCYFKSLLVFEMLGDKKESATVLDAIGAAYAHMSDYPNSLDHFFRVFDLARELGEKEMEARALNNIASLYMQLGEWSKALVYLRDSLVIFEGMADKRGQADALDNSCSCYCDLGDYDKALTCGLRSVRLYREISDQEGEAKVLDSIGGVYKARGDYTQALAYFNRALNISEGISLRIEIVKVLQNIGNIYRSLGHIDMALESLQRALVIAQEINSKSEQYRCHKELVDIYKQLGDYTRALEHSEQYHETKEEVFNEETDRRIKNLEAIHQVETARKETEIYQLKNVALQQEINERRQVEDALRVTNQQLHEAIIEGEQLIADLNAFDYMVAHDLKTPLTNLVLSSEILWDKVSGTLDADTVAFLDVVRQMANKMNLIINELLVLASVRQQQVVSQTLEMGVIVEQAETRLRYMITESNAEIIKPSTWPKGLGYAQWVEEVWANYISNAIKYGGSPPRIELGAEQKTDGSVRYWVHDNGNGLSQEAINQLFTAFTRLDKVRATGHGLGLSIVKRIIEKLNGTVDIQSDGLPGRGSIFSFTLPGPNGM
jgi:signal transduction histidine kinase/Tfp pilus assembly protein PilF